MSYIINKTDGSRLTEIVDGAIDQTATDLTLIGKNVSYYGEFYNENLVKLLENFASTTAPNNPIQGQLWFDSSEGRLKIYDGNGFKTSSGPVVSTTVPTTLSQGDLWIDSANQQFYFHDGVSKTLAGPIYTANQGVTGFNVTDITDSFGNIQIVAMLYVARELIGIYSKSEFEPASNIAGWSGSTYSTIATYALGNRVMYTVGNKLSVYEATAISVPVNNPPPNLNYWRKVIINPGFNSGTISGLKYSGVVTSADALSGSDGISKTAADFLQIADESPLLAGSLTITNTTPLILGSAQNNEIQVTTQGFSIIANNPGQNFYFRTKQGSILQYTMTLDSTNQRVGILTSTPEATLDVNGDAVIQGNLTVLGNLTTVNSTNLEIEDKLIELGRTESPSNATADGGGILLAAGSDVDKTLLWQLSTESWLFSENINISSSKTYKIDGTTVLSDTALGNTITSANGLTSIGTLSSLQAANINISNNIISFETADTNGSIIFKAKGSGVISVNNSNISDVADPISSKDAVNLQVLSNTVRTTPLGFTFNTSAMGLPNIQLPVVIAKIFPVSEHNVGTICRVYRTDTNTVKRFILTAGVPNYWNFAADE